MIIQRKPIRGFFDGLDSFTFMEHNLLPEVPSDLLDIKHHVAVVVIIEADIFCIENSDLFR